MPSVVVGQTLKFDAQLGGLAGINLAELLTIQAVPSNLVNVSSITIDNLTNTSLLTGLLTGGTVNISDAFKVVPGSIGAISGKVCLQVTILSIITPLGCGNFNGTATPPPPTFMITLAGGSLLFFGSMMQRRIKPYAGSMV